ncbi:MAG: hypothetical protein ABJB03_00545 [Rhodoglobus sp.]
MGNANKDLVFNIFGRDRNASSTLLGIGKNGQRTAKMLHDASVRIGIGLLAATGAAIAFGKESVQAFADAQASQNKLSFAYEKFPALADASIDSLRKLNSELALKTRYDDDATASGQAVLAQFNLSGQQILKLTPLLQDYAAKTGKELPDAATDLGKALLGQGRALKAIGIEFTDTGTTAGNFDELMASLSTTVGGFAEKDGQTAAGQLIILQNRFGETEETIGEALLPTLGELMDFFETDVMPNVELFADWLANVGIPNLVNFAHGFKDAADYAPALVGGLSLVTAGMWLLNVAMDANPVGATILLLGAGVLWWGSFVAAAQNATGGINVAMYFMGQNFLRQINLMIGFAQAFIDPLNMIIGAINFLTGTDFSAIHIPTLAVDGPTAQGYAVGGMLGIEHTSAQGGRTGGKSSVPVVPTGVKATPFADGGIVRHSPGGIFAQVGEGRHDELIAPLTPANLAALGAGGGTSGGTTFIFEGDSAALASLFNVYEQRADGSRVLISKMGKQVR